MRRGKLQRSAAVVYSEFKTFEQLLKFGVIHERVVSPTFKGNE